MASNIHPDDKGVTQYMDAAVQASLFPGDGGKAEAEYALIRKL